MKKHVLKVLKDNLSPFYKKFLFSKWMIEYNYSKKASIREIHVEFSSYCNLRCKWCSLNHSKQKIDLTEEILDKMLRNLVYDNRFSRVKKLNLWNAGEALLNKNFIPLLKLIKKYKNIGIERNGYFPAINLLTNGMLLNESISEKIVVENVLDKIMFSVDGGTKEEYEEIRRGAKWNLLVKNVNNFLRINKGIIKTEVICMVDSKRPLNSNWMDHDFRDVLKKVDIVSLRHPHNWDGSIDLGLKKKLEVKKGCYFSICQLVLLPNGDITVCCADLNSRGVIGNILKNSLFEIYLSKKRKAIIEYNLAGKRKLIPLCQNCDVE
jgi:radical SAM protein with 4Fe4S-binding SPASM domain